MYDELHVLRMQFLVTQALIAPWYSFFFEKLQIFFLSKNSHPFKSKLKKNFHKQHKINFKLKEFQKVVIFDDESGRIWF